MAYIKNGIVTRIDVCGENNDLSYVNKLFDLSIYEKVDNKYLLFEDVLQDNFKSYRTEYLEFSCYSGDSLSCCESYCLNVDINKLLDNKIHLTKDNKNYYFENYEDVLFDTDVCHYIDDNVYLKFSLIPVFWDTNRVECEDFINTMITVNNLTRKAMKNVSKGASWFSVI